MKIIHSGDIHVCREYQKKAFVSLKKLVETGYNERIDLFVLGGDLFDASMQNTEADGFPELLEIITEMLNIAPVITVYGTPTHDIPGCYDVFTRIKAKYNFIILYPGKSYCLKNLLILGCPEPQKNWFIGNQKGVGREEANQAIIDGMKNIFLGLGAIRREHLDTPCLMVYHGSVSGSTLQNGQLLGQGEISIGKDDLKMVGADYYALNHIHLHQEIFPNAYFSGSAYATDWGERDQKAFNLIEINQDEFGGRSTMVRKINFPHPPLKKIEKKYAETEIVNPDDFRGFKVWLEISCTEEESKFINLQKWNDSILKNGALPGSKVTVRKIARETVRAQEIQTVQHLRDKVKVYAESSSLSVPSEPILEKADLLEKELYQHGEKFQELSIRIKSLHLRGAIGTIKNSGREEVFLDFDSYNPGIISIVGKTGSGKTTLLENLHPYSCLLTRPGKLQDHFKLMDSFRDLRFVDEKTGDEYRSLIQIDGQNKSGKVDANLFRKNGSGSFEPLTNGRLKDYEEKIIELFGSLDLFLKSAFISQKPSKGSPDLSGATKGQRKALFLELAGLEKYQKYVENSKAKRKNLEDSILKPSGEISALESDFEQKTQIENDIKDTQKKIDHINLDLFAANRVGKEAKEKLETLEKKAIENNKIAAEINQLMSKIAENELKINQNDKKIAENEKLLSEKDKHEQNIILFDSAMKKIKEIELINKEIRKDNDSLREKYEEAVKSIQISEKQIIEKCHQSDRRLDQLRSLYEVNYKELENKEKEIEALEQNKNCPTCGQPLTAKALSIFNEKIIDIKKITEGLKESITLDQFHIDSEKKLKDSFEEQRSLIKYPNKPEYKDENKTSEFERIIDKINIEESRHIVSDAEKAKYIIDETRKTNLELVSNNEYDKAHLEKLNNEYDKLLPEMVLSAKKEYEKLREEYSIKQSNLKVEKTRLELLNKSLDSISKKSEKLEQLKKETSEIKENISDWSYLEKACGPDGIQALELDALSPNIEAEVNQILRSAYDDRFSIQFQTTRMGGSGKNTKQIEDFLIMVNDNDNIQELSTLSGGEEVWIKKAIYDAFGIIGNRNTGTNFLTVCMDEADGALDYESKQKYLKMVQASHQQSGKHHTIIITHDPFIQQQISQKIVMEEL